MSRGWNFDWRDLATGLVCALIGIAATLGLVWTLDHDRSVLPVTPIVATTPSLPPLPEVCDVTMEGDEEHVYPCADGSINVAVDEDGNQHRWCRVILTNAEDAYVICADGWRADS